MKGEKMEQTINVLDKVNSPEDVKKLGVSEMYKLADEIRKTMGHSLERSIQFLIKICLLRMNFRDNR